MFFIWGWERKIGWMMTTVTEDICVWWLKKKGATMNYSIIIEVFSLFFYFCWLYSYNFKNIKLKLFRSSCNSSLNFSFISFANTPLYINTQKEKKTFQSYNWNNTWKFLLPIFCCSLLLKKKTHTCNLVMF